MNGERAYYFAEFLRVVFPLAPIGLMLIAMIFLRRNDRTRHTFWLQTSAAIWLVLAIGNRLMFAWGRGVFSVGDPNRLDRLQMFMRISDLTWNLETAVFVVFAILLLIYFKQRLPAGV